MTSVELRDQEAAHAARTAYAQAAERHAEHALSEQDHGHRLNARYLARLARRCQKAAAAEYPQIRRVA